MNTLNMTPTNIQLASSDIFSLTAVAKSDGIMHSALKLELTELNSHDEPVLLATCAVYLDCGTALAREFDPTLKPVWRRSGVTLYAATPEQEQFSEDVLEVLWQQVTPEMLQAIFRK